jgi:tetratricopeptide (TPR) repeat protein
LGLGLFAALLVIYLPALGGLPVWDDDAHITRTALRSLDGLRAIWTQLGATQQYYPLLHSAFWMEAQLWGDAMLGYHAVNVALHTTAALLIVVLTQRLGVRGGWIAAVLFAVHPVQVESVAWVSELKNTLSLVFYLAGAIAWLRFEERRTAGAYAAALAWFVAALMTKTVTATLPAAILVVAWWRRGRIEGKRDVAPLVPWFVLAAASGLFTAWVERHLIGAEGSEFALSFVERLLLAARIVVFYLRTIAFPNDLIFSYPHWVIRADDPAQWLYPSGLLAVVGGAWWIRGRTRAPLAVLLLFIGALFPVLGFFDVYPFRYSYVADHFVYLPSVALFVATGAVLTDWLARDRPQEQAAGRGAIAALVALLAFRSWTYARDYTDAETLYRATLARNPDSWMAHQNLGRILARSERRMGEAIPHFEAVLRLKPDHLRAHYSLGQALYVTGRRADAAPHLERAIALDTLHGLMTVNSRTLLDSIARDVTHDGAGAGRATASSAATSAAPNPSDRRP